MMTMAGVPAEEVQQFVTKHKEKAAGANLAVTETGIRDLTEEQTERTDINCIPVICMGYYGGWSHDPEELAQQQQKILDTFPNKEKFIIVGTRPMDGSVDAATLDATLKAKWGKNYISAAEVTTSPSSTYEAQAEIAQAVLDKLEEIYTKRRIKRNNEQNREKKENTDKKIFAGYDYPACCGNCSGYWLGYMETKESKEKDRKCCIYSDRKEKNFRNHYLRRKRLRIQRPFKQFPFYGY